MIYNNYYKTIISKMNDVLNNKSLSVFIINIHKLEIVCIYSGV